MYVPCKHLEHKFHVISTPVFSSYRTENIHSLELTDEGNLTYLFTYLFTYLLNYLLTYSMEQVLIEKLTGFQPVKKFPTFYGNRRFITAFTSARYLSLS